MKPLASGHKTAFDKGLALHYIDLMKIEKTVEMTGVLLKVCIVAHLADGAVIRLWVSKRMDTVRFYGHGSVKRYEAGADYRVDPPALEWVCFFRDDTSARAFEAYQRALSETGRLSGDAAARLASYARSAVAEARAFGTLAEFNA